jgi:predicted flap endonuclease-1-like 5' DNA nuclease
MSLVPCAACSRRLSPLAVQCPSCGHPVDVPYVEPKPKQAGWFATAVVCVGGLWLLSRLFSVLDFPNGDPVPSSPQPVAQQPARKAPRASAAPSAPTAKTTAQASSLPSAPVVESKSQRPAQPSVATIAPQKSVQNPATQSAPEADRKSLPATSASTASRQASAPSQPKARIDGITVSPEDLLAKLRITGLTQVTSWRRSNLDDSWWGTARVLIGSNEVSCHIESSRPDVVESLALEAEFHDPYAARSPVVLQFAKSMGAFLTEMPASLADAIANEGSWRSGRWSFKKDPYPSGTGYDLRLEYK